MTVGENIKRIRKEKGLTQKKLGELCGINEANIRKYENGKQNPKIETIEKIADALRCSVDELRGVKIYKKLSSELFAEYPALKIDFIEQIKEMADFENNPDADIIERMLKSCSENNDLLAECYDSILDRIEIDDDARKINCYYLVSSPEDAKGIMESTMEKEAIYKRMIQADIERLNEKGLSKVKDFTGDIAKIEEYCKKNVSESDTKDK